MMEKDGVGFPRVGTPEQDHVSVFSFTIRTGAAACSEDRRQTGDAGRVSSSVAAIDIVCPHYGADKLLRRIVQLIRGLGTAEHPEIAPILFGNGLLKSGCNPVKRFIPSGRAMRAVFAHQWLG
jgi:hypothetical protein